MNIESGVKVNGVITNKNGTILKLKDLLEKLEEIELVYDGSETEEKKNSVKPKGSTKSAKEKFEDHEFIQLSTDEELAKMKRAVKLGFYVPMTTLLKTNSSNVEFSRHFKSKLPNYKGRFIVGQNGVVDSNTIIDSINSYLENKGIGKRLNFPKGDGVYPFLIKVTDNLDLEVVCIFDHFGHGYSSEYIKIENFIINEETTKKDVDKLIEFIEILEHQ